MVLLFLKRDKGGQERGDYIGQQVGEEESGNGWGAEARGSAESSRDSEVPT